VLPHEFYGTQSQTLRAVAPRLETRVASSRENLARTQECLQSLNCPADHARRRSLPPISSNHILPFSSIPERFPVTTGLSNRCAAVPQSLSVAGKSLALANSLKRTFSDFNPGGYGTS
jgi:hypothetical protein